MKNLTIVIICLLALGLGVAVVRADTEKAATAEKAAADDSAKKSEPQAEYIGAKTCKMCHSSKKVGNQYKIWSEGPHAKAFDGLGTEEAMKLAKKAGVEGSPQESPKCIKCHATSAGLKAEQMAKKLKPEDGVQCETCHGPGSEHQKLMMKKAKTESVYAPISEKTCQKCHNEESPTYKKFEFAKFKAVIAHPIPGEEEPKKASPKAETQGG